MSKASNLQQYSVLQNNTLEVVFHSAIELVSYLETVTDNFSSQKKKQKKTRFWQRNTGGEVPSTGSRSSTVSFKLLPLLNTRTVCHSLSFTFWPAKIVSGPLPAGQSKQWLTHMHASTPHTSHKGWEMERRTDRTSQVVWQRQKILR